MMGLLKTLWRPDWEEDPERTVVARAANILSVGEFQLLQLAYHHWFGCDMAQATSDAVFRAYMIHGEIPSWARHFAREVLERDEQGEISESDPFWHRYDHDYVTHVPKGVRTFVLASMFLAFFMVGATLIGALSVEEPISMLPPYFEKGKVE